ncbi:TetR/AcrR family transcriptional regulator [Nostoc sp. MS1]|uniref:TetR/AcrR family transcriptional regulator n=1 Tax=Nostoc sp. MS1 TaxID=2764711 RepID=UPI001CC797FB|nr:TetR/AcrR family transcriptional regulator [Nostoc sp. MS1]BCL36907.1 hypothetical protein NSMS1_33540 [Nostoc sp. MS1]
MNKRKARIESNNNDRLPSAEKVDAILNGAMQEFLAHGYTATTMDRVTAVAGVSKTTVYSYFQDKEGLFVALIERLAQEKYFAIRNPEFFQGEPHIVLRRIATNIFTQMEQEPEFLGLVRVIIGESGRFPSLAQTFVQNIDKAAIKLLSQYFADHEELQLPDPEVAARIFLGTLVHFIILQYMLHGQDILPMQSDRLIDNLINLITINLCKNPSTDKYSGTRQKSTRRKRSASGKFKMDYACEPKQLRSVRLTDTAWEKLAEIAEQHNLTRSEMIEIFARKGFSGNPDDS